MVIDGGGGGGGRGRIGGAGSCLVSSIKEVPY